MSNIRRLSDEDIDTYISQLGGGHELGDLRQSEDEDIRPWERKKPDGFTDYIKTRAKS